MDHSHRHDEKSDKLGRNLASRSPSLRGTPSYFRSRSLIYSVHDNRASPSSSEYHVML